jgi:hypothetical protein
MIWNPLEGGAGTLLAACGTITAAAQVGELTLWSQEVVVSRTAAGAANPARPRIIGDRAYWGPYVVEVDSGAPGARLTPPAPPGYEQTAHAWAPDGRAAVVAARRTGPGGRSPAVVALLDSSGGQTAVLWEADDLAPTALAFGPDHVVIGTRGPRVFDRAGRPVRTLPADTAPFRIDVDQGGGRILVAEHATLTVWDLAAEAEVGRRRGNWVDASLTPDGTRVVTVEFSGRIGVYRASPGLPTAAELEADAPALAVAATDDRVAAAFVRPPAIRTAAL